MTDKTYKRINRFNGESVMLTRKKQKNTMQSLSMS